MTAEDNRYSPKMDASSMGGGREPRFDVPPMQGRDEPHETRPRETRIELPDDELPVEEAFTPAQAKGPAPAADTAELEKARAEAAEYKDKALRAVAELENYRRRADKERDDVAKYAISNFAREMLPVADNLRRALDAQPAAEGDAAAPLKAFVSGVELTERELLAAFERFGLKKIDPLGEPFDHNFHQAMFEIEDSTKPAGTVVQVMQSGYLLKDRLLRPALVAVSKGGPARATDERQGGSAQGGSGAHGSYTAPSGGEGHRFDTKA